MDIDELTREEELLIDAAPDMLAALQRVVALDGEHYETRSPKREQECYQQCVAAIAKALGQK